MAFLLFKTDVGDVVKRESDIFASKSSFGMQRQITNEPDDANRHNLLIRRLEERYGPLIAQCQEASSLSKKLNLKGELPIQFPRIIVVGCESAGKSSIIERLAGFRFFPIGQGLTTRMPISMSLKLTNIDACMEICEEHHLNFDPNRGNPIIGLRPFNSAAMQYFVDDRAADRIQTEMTRYLTEENQGRPVGISEVEFELEILHWTVPNLKFVDLPGVVSARRDEEPPELPTRTRNLTMRYLKDPNSLIIAVVPCTEHIVNNVIVGMIQDANAINRTLCVLTKIDITIPSTSVISSVLGTALGSEPFRDGFGYIGISNGEDGRMRDMARITRSESEFCAPLILRHPQIRNRLGLACLVNVLIDKFEIHLR